MGERSGYTIFNDRQSAPLKFLETMVLRVYKDKYLEIWVNDGTTQFIEVHEKLITAGRDPDIQQ